MEIAESLKLPVESINQAGAFFLSKLGKPAELKKHLVLFDQSKNCKIFRPDFYLFIQLKIARLSPSDLEDCLVFTEHFKEEVKTHQKKVLLLLNQKLEQLPSDKRENLKILIKKIS